jgi:hypothetical protein
MFAADTHMHSFVRLIPCRLYSRVQDCEAQKPNAEGWLRGVWQLGDERGGAGLCVSSILVSS